MSRKERQEPEKLETNMSAMIDVVFQLLIFFMLTLKIVEPEGDFTISPLFKTAWPTLSWCIMLPPRLVGLFIEKKI